MADNDLEARLKLTGDSKGAEKAIDDVRKKFTSTDKEVRSLSSHIRTGFKDSAKVIGKTTDELRALENEARNVGKALNDATAAKKKFGREQVGDISTSLGSLASVAGAAGGGAGVEALRLGGDLAGAAEYAGRFKDALNDAGKAAQNAGGVIGGLANAGASVASILPGVSVGFGAVAAVAAPLAIAAGLVAVAFTKVQEQARVAAAATDFFLAKRTAASEAEKTLTTEEAQKRLDEARAREQELNQIIADGATIRQRTFDEAAAQSGDLLARVSTAAAETGGVFAKFDEDVAKAKSELAAAQGEIAGLENALKQGKTAANDAKVATEETAKAEEDLSVKREQHRATIASLQEQEDALNAAYKERQKLTAQDRLRGDIRSAVDEVIQKKRANEDLNRALEEQAAAHEQNMLTIAERANEQIAQAYKDLTTKQLESAKQIADIESAFQSEQLKAERQFTKDRIRAQEDFRLSVKRLKEDLKESLSDAIAENDVDAFLRAQRDTGKTIKRGREDFRTDRRRGGEDFADDRAAAEQAKNERIADIQEELAAYQLATAEKVAQIEAQKQADLVAAETTYQDKLAKDAELRAIENERDVEDQALRNERRDADRALEDSRAQAALDSAIQKIDAKQLAENTALDQLGAKATAVRGAESALLSLIIAKAQQAQAALAAASQGYGSSGKVITPKFASGAEKITRGGRAIVHANETIIPAAQAESFRKNRTGQKPVINVNIGAPNVVTIGGKQYVEWDVFKSTVDKLAKATENAFAEIV